MTAGAAMAVDSADFPARVAGVDPAGPLAPALALRADIFAMTGRSRRSVLAPAEPGGLDTALRLGLAVRIARQNRDDALADAYGAFGAADPAVADPAVADPATADPATAGGAGAPARAAMLRHADLLTLTPRAAGEADIVALRDAGVAEPDIVRLSQLVAFVNYEARVVAGLRALAVAPWSTA